MLITTVSQLQEHLQSGGDLGLGEDGRLYIVEERSHALTKPGGSLPYLTARGKARFAAGQAAFKAAVLDLIRLEHPHFSLPLSDISSSQSPRELALKILSCLPGTKKENGWDKGVFLMTEQQSRILGNLEKDLNRTVSNEEMEVLQMDILQAGEGLQKILEKEISALCETELQKHKGMSVHPDFVSSSKYEIWDCVQQKMVVIEDERKEVAMQRLMESFSDDQPVQLCLSLLASSGLMASLVESALTKTIQKDLRHLPRLLNEKQLCLKEVKQVDMYKWSDFSVSGWLVFSLGIQDGPPGATKEITLARGGCEIELKPSPVRGGTSQILLRSLDIQGKFRAPQ